MSSYSFVSSKTATTTPVGLSVVNMVHVITFYPVDDKECVEYGYGRDASKTAPVYLIRFFTVHGIVVWRYPDKESRDREYDRIHAKYVSCDVSW